MTLKQEILAESIGYKGANFESNFFFTKLAQGFTKDYKIFKEDTLPLYDEVFGEEYHPIFEEIEKNVLLIESIVDDNTILLFENPWDDWLKQNKIKSPGSSSMGSDPLKNYVPAKTAKEGFKEVANATPKIAASTVKTGSPKAGFDLAKSMNTGYDKTAAFLSKIWDKIKTFGKGLAEKFPKLLPVLQKGLSWIIENPFKVIGIAGGSVLLGKLLISLKRRGEDKKAARIQAALNQVKEKEASKEQKVETQKS
jgi:hypothetical protein